MSKRSHLRPLVAAMALALVVPGVAFGQTAKERELEARIAQLEAQVQALLTSQQQTQATIAETQTRLDEVRVAQPALPAGSQPRAINELISLLRGGNYSPVANIGDRRRAEK